MVSVFVESFLGSFLGLVVGGGILMLGGFLGVRHFVRVIMNEVWQCAAQRVTNVMSATKKDKRKDEEHIEPFMNK